MTRAFVIYNNARIATTNAFFVKCAQMRSIDKVDRVSRDCVLCIARGRIRPGATAHLLGFHARDPVTALILRGITYCCCPASH